MIAAVHADAPVVARLREAGATREALDRLLEERPVPVVEGQLHTFLWWGDADRVGVEHRIVSLPAPIQLHRLPGSDLWHATVELPTGTRMEYRLLVRRGGHVESMLDPLNPKVVTGPMGETSVLLGEGYVTPDWGIEDPDAPKGEMVDRQYASTALGHEAKVTIYIPARAHSAKTLPLLIVHDGGDFLNHSGLNTVLDNLMHQRLVADCIVVLTYPVDRLNEYAANPAHSRFLTEELVPDLEGFLPVLQGKPAGRVVSGASFGAVASLAAAAHAPGFFGGLLLQSASLRYTTEGWKPVGGAAVFAPVVRFVDELRKHPRTLTKRIYQSYGAFEPLADTNRSLVTLMKQLADEVLVNETLDGHNWIAWRDQLRAGLSFLLPGPVAGVAPIGEDA
jgi:enterochelin esterase-like enzyme